MANTLLDRLDQENNQATDQADDSAPEVWDKEVALRMNDLEAGRAVTVS